MWVTAAIAVVGSIFNFMGASAAAKNQQIVNKANVYAQKTTAEANNLVETSRASLSNFIREENNRKVMEKAGDQFNMIGQNITRAQNAYTRGSLQERIQATEYLGSIAASAAFAGVGGSTVEMIDSTLRRTMAVSQEGARRNQELKIGDMRNERFNQISNAVAGTDMGQTIARFQNTIIPEPYVAKPTWLNLVGDIANNYMAMGGTFGKGGTGAQRVGGLGQIGS